MCIFQITYFTQISSPKPCMHLPNYLFHSNILNKTLCASSKLPLSLKSSQQNFVCIFQGTSFTQISSTKHCVHLPSYLFHSNLLNKTLYATSKLTLSLKFPHQNPVCICPLPHTCHITRPSHSSGLYRSSNIW